MKKSYVKESYVDTIINAILPIEFVPPIIKPITPYIQPYNYSIFHPLVQVTQQIPQQVQVTQKIPQQVQVTQKIPQQVSQVIQQIPATTQYIMSIPATTKQYNHTKIIKPPQDDILLK